MHEKMIHMSIFNQESYNQMEKKNPFTKIQFIYV